MSITFQNRLEITSGMKLKLKINDNRSTMLSVKWEDSYTSVSLHRMFLEAPQNIMDSLACYLRQEDETLSSNVRQFIEKSLQTIDYTDRLDQMQLSTKGKIYDLKSIYQQLNREYFDGKLQLAITWFGSATKRSRSRLIFGAYEEPLRLIKIHRVLDNCFYPIEVVSFIVYHEMLHHIHPSYFDEKGQHQIHTKEFKAQEREFRYYEYAEDWLKENMLNFFL